MDLYSSYVDDLGTLSRFLHFQEIKEFPRKRHPAYMEPLSFDLYGRVHILLLVSSNWCLCNGINTLDSRKCSSWISRIYRGPIFNPKCHKSEIIFLDEFVTLLTLILTSSWNLLGPSFIFWKNLFYMYLCSSIGIVDIYLLFKRVADISNNFSKINLSTSFVAGPAKFLVNLTWLLAESSWSTGWEKYAPDQSANYVSWFEVI